MEEVAKFHDNSARAASGKNTCGMPLWLVPDANASTGYRYLQLNRDAVFLSCPKCGHFLRPEEFVDAYEDEEEKTRREKRAQFFAHIDERVAQGQETLETVLSRLKDLAEMIEGADEWYGRDFYEPADLVNEAIAIVERLQKRGDT